MGILAALFDAQRTGQGRHVDVAIADGVLAHAVVPLAGVNLRGSTQPAGADKLTGDLPCYAMYKTRDGRFVAVGALEKKFWDTFCDVIERADLKALHHPLTPEQSVWVRKEVSELIGAQTWAYWRDKLEGADCCVTPVLKLEESLLHPQFVARGMVRPGLTAAGKPFVQFGSPVQMTDFAFAIRYPSPQQGQHTQEILLQAGYTHDEVAALMAQGTVV
jgi:crotonobetainyl-CoA:carnitine CoA-transferase CaiB-like acyl-CoA transferase